MKEIVFYQVEQSLAHLAHLAQASAKMFMGAYLATVEKNYKEHIRRHDL